jgi:predicted RecA/RadA family phage recombinase
MKNLVRQSATNLTLPAPYAVNSGQGALIGSIFGVASTDALINADCVFVTRGEYTFPKVASQAWTLGQKVYWDNTARVMTNVATGNTHIGVATKAVGNGAGETVGQVKLGVVA